MSVKRSDVSTLTLRRQALSCSSGWKARRLLRLARCHRRAASTQDPRSLYMRTWSPPCRAAASAVQLDPRRLLVIVSPVAEGRIHAVVVRAKSAPAETGAQYAAPCRDSMGGCNQRPARKSHLPDGVPNLPPRKAERVAVLGHPQRTKWSRSRSRAKCLLGTCGRSRAAANHLVFRFRQTRIVKAHALPTAENLDVGFVRLRRLPRHLR